MDFLSQSPWLWWFGGFVAFTGSWLCTLWLCRIGELSVVGHDTDSGVQKFHVKPTSRLGGLGIMFGYLATLASLFALQRTPIDARSSEWVQIWFGLALCSLPVFLGGLVEDLTHRVRPRIRLALALLSAALAYWGLGVGVFKTDVSLVDALLVLPSATFFVTLLVVAGFTHAVNIVDGFHGLASGSVMIMLCALMAISRLCQDMLLVHLCGLALLCTLGFFVLNWPIGRIFLGDAGAYLLGFWVVELGLLLVNRNPQISPMAPVVVGIFPLIETLFSIYRRKFVRQHPVNHPDGLHLHTLIYRRLTSNPRHSHDLELQNSANAKVAFYFWVPGLVTSACAVYFRSNTNAQLILMLTCLIVYCWLYRRLIGFKAPRWLNARNKPR